MAPSAVDPAPEQEYVVYHKGKKHYRPVLSGKDLKPTFEAVPMVDFSKAESLSLGDRRRVARDVHKAFSEVGFLYASNHGISRELQEDVLRVTKEFFALPEEEKLKTHINNSWAIRGYEALFETKLDETTRGDLKEAFNIAEDPFDSEQRCPEDYDKSWWPENANQWPAIPADFRKVIYQYWDAILEFSKTLMHLIALSLGLDESHFDDMARFPMCGLRALHYPSQEIASDIGLGAHADYSWFTLVNQLSPTTALEVLNANGHWISAPPIPNTLVVNVGDFLERATNNQFVSTIHRVVNRTGAERYSIPFFFQPSHECTVEVLSTCITEQEPAKYESINAGDWYRERLLRARYKHPSSIAARVRGDI